MVEKTVKQDINANIANLSFDVDTNCGTPYAVISFDNICDSAITAIKLKAKGYNSFGDLIQIDGLDEFYLLIQDLHIEKSAVNIRVALPNTDIRRIELSESQICLIDNTIVEYKGEKFIEYNVSELESNNAEDIEIINLLKEYSPYANNIPLQIDDGWICACGQYNHHSNANCRRCSADSNIMQSLCGEKELADAVVEHAKQVKENEHIERKKKSKKSIIISIAAVAILALTAFLINLISSKNAMFVDDEEMASELKGTWMHTIDYGNWVDGWGFRVSDNTLTWIGCNSNVSCDITWKANSNAFLANGERFEYDGNTITHKGVKYTKNGAKSNTNQNTDVGKLELYGDTYGVISVGGYATITGVVKNNTKTDYSSVEINFDVYDANGNKVCVAMDNINGLSAGESWSFEALGHGVSGEWTYKLASIEGS